LSSCHRNNGNQCQFKSNVGKGKEENIAASFFKRLFVLKNSLDQLVIA
jgi:hypothetical protein